jgi:hypothetical protein
MKQLDIFKKILFFYESNFINKIIEGPPIKMLPNTLPKNSSWLIGDP